MVIAPHPDDEALGCGGLVAAFRGLGRAVCVVFVTDGGASHLGSQSVSRTMLARLRRDEALRSIETLGLHRTDAHFFDLPDADMPEVTSPRGRPTVTDLANLIHAFDPDLILSPWRRDPHRDHRDSWTLLQAALQEAGKDIRQFEYAIWLAELGDPGDWPSLDEMERIDFDISAYVHIKRAAVMAHKTQILPLIDDDPNGFRLTDKTIGRLVQPLETYWRGRDEID